MKRQLFVYFGLVVSLASWAGAGAQAQGATQDAKKGKPTTVTGCLAKGTDASSYVLNDAMPGAAAKEQSKEASKSAEMRSYHVMAKDSSLKLADHVGHKVTLTGTVGEMGGESATGTPKTGAVGSTGGAAGATAGGKGASMPHLTVTSMKHVAATCTP